MSARAFEIMANLAKRRALRGIQTVCETQHQISTRKLEHYTETAGDELAGYAFNLRNEFDKITKERDSALAECERLREALSDLSGAVKTINKGKQHQIQINGDDQPCYWQREEWVEYALELCDSADAALSAKP